MPKTHHYDPDDVIRSLEGKGSVFATIVESRLSRRGVLSAAAATAGVPAIARWAWSDASSATSLGFDPIEPSLADEVVVPEGYAATVLLSWGDAILDDADVASRRFGYNNDYVGFFATGPTETVTRGVLGVNHEYVNPEIMFPTPGDQGYSDDQLRELVESVGFSVVEVALDAEGKWRPLIGASLNRRVSLSTPIDITGPARGHKRLMTSSDPKGEVIKGTSANCSGGTTPWGTFLSGEENFQDMFGNAGVVTEPWRKRSFDRYGVTAKKAENDLNRIDPRFDVANEPNEPYRFGWVVEIDPQAPDRAPKKRTALGRFRHEAATTYVAANGSLVLYSGCDARFEYVYKFVASGAYNSFDRQANLDLLDEGTLYAARFDEDGTGVWLPLVHGLGPLNSNNGFNDQGDVVIDARIAADLLGATKMDRPEDIEVNPVNQKVYVVCTNNTDRGMPDKGGTNRSNPRVENKHGHIVELTETGDDHTALTFAWELFLVCGDPSDPSTYFGGYDKTQVSAVSCPDNIAFDGDGNLWIATDGQPKTLKVNDGIYVCPVAGPERGKMRQFMSVPKGAECAGPCFTPDFKTLFVSIQHPGEGGTYEAQTSVWPDGSAPPRPSVVAVRTDDGRVIGTEPGLSRRGALGRLARGLPS